METPSKKELVEYMQKLSQLYYDVSHRRISDKEAMHRLDVLKAEQRRLEELGAFVNTSPDTQKRHKVSKPRHSLELNCFCPRCIKKTTITMQDRDLLKSMGIVWRSSTKT